MTDTNRTKIESMVNQYEKKVLSRLNDEYEKTTTFGDRIADRIASFGGSWTFILIFSAFLFLWLVWNSIAFTKHFDEKPFILLNLILSFIASFQAPIIMMSQNRQSARDKHESIIDFAINYRAEEDINDIQEHLHRMEKEIAAIKTLLQAQQKSQD